jgi:hypothetical protein
MTVKPYSLMIGIATHIPVLRRLTGLKTGGTVSSRYCYSVWLRHLSLLRRSGLPTTIGTLVELGPGDSLGIGLGALLSGVEHYIALDVVRYADKATNLRIFDELITLFEARAPVPDDTEFPLLRPPLESYEFPAEALSPARLQVTLHSNRVEAIRAAIEHADETTHRGPLVYIAPWKPGVIEPGTVDLVLSQSVLQYPPELEGLYCEMCDWLRPGGVLSHEIDFKSLGLTVEWNGHWSCSEVLWQLTAGRRRHKSNREPHSAHIALIERTGLRVACDERVVRPSGITRTQLARRFRHLSDQDLTTSSAFIQAVKESARSE